MKTAAREVRTFHEEVAAGIEEKTIRLPKGLLGLEMIQRLSLIANPDELPFMWLQVQEDANMAFVVISPFIIKPDYQPQIADEDAEFLELDGPEEALILSIVTFRGRNAATANLKGPIVINTRNQIGKQIIPLNAAELELQFPFREATCQTRT